MRADVSVTTHTNNLVILKLGGRNYAMSPEDAQRLADELRRVAGEMENGE